MSSISTKLRKGQIIDVLDGANRYSGLIVSVASSTITVDTGWYKVDSTQTTGTPSTGSQIKIVPNTKVWATNLNVMLKSTSDATSMVGIELGLFNNKTNAPTG
ncbi:hypothetical protein EDM39_14485 [Staphylococcus aureus]|nr:hypothetical protein EDM39_14485 [Staphylococcus aureus]